MGRVTANAGFCVVLSLQLLYSSIDNYQNFCYLYLKADNLTNINNFVYDIKIPKENKILARYLKDYL